ncbi:hypothetical protein HG537_0H04170 [Torulaspora globosa]|uniref:Uncharacterized protein n=1 Tax=Torulaspora globosa TaxID=48254 RepID=A0A7H9HY33_9SACH|nr:hypothetical protein HG537_0H04170 [Torulaspora sp. CBS 2947]
MEKLNSLHSSLPPERSPTDQTIESLNKELSQEFKIAANAVTKLYRVANERNSLLKHHGYLQCVENLLSMLQQEPGLSVEDIHLWCIKQRNEILSYQSAGGNGEQGKSTGTKYNFDFTNAGDTSGDGDATVKVPTFRLSTPPLSVEYSKPEKTMWSVQKQQTWKSVPCNYQEKNDDCETSEQMGSQQLKDTVSPHVKKQKVTSTVVTACRRKAKTDRRE